jgi:hypothetical protein
VSERTVRRCQVDEQDVLDVLYVSKISCRDLSCLTPKPEVAPLTVPNNLKKDVPRDNCEATGSVLNALTSSLILEWLPFLGLDQFLHHESELRASHHYRGKR